MVQMYLQKLCKDRLLAELNMCQFLVGRNQVIWLVVHTHQNELDLQFYGDGSYLEVKVEYAEDLFKGETVKRLLQHHENILRELSIC